MLWVISCKTIMVVLEKVKEKKEERKKIGKKS